MVCYTLTVYLYLRISMLINVNKVIKVNNYSEQHDIFTSEVILIFNINIIYEFELELTILYIRLGDF